ncbi:LacI family DNA-binding transcriptional regulator [Pontibacter sp. 172403-2]|uniref:LacI family DNA-binding transcriptional regulator n=1 Tax=Pontibacter rufus TaxID=2791028 RepID=UPI0018AFD575|nr:LacI family DNA-binding transcriptional regulator [Pontibacter sp. 172403-2]MBF9254091.1 LacI family DNA-binding transcriptional regulator [Pontibacter sp. 172403-2]
MSKQPQYTIKDIATEMGVSVSTVSRALSDHPHISEETKGRVRELAEKYDYRHNALAASLRNSRSNTIGLILPRLSQYFPSTVATAIQNKLHEYGYNLMICQSNDSPALEKELVNVLYASRVEGLIVSSTLYTSDFSHFDIFAKSKIPLVFYDRFPKNYEAHKVQGDDYTGGYQNTLHLLQQGCRRIAHISGPLTCNIYEDRYNGYLDALKKYEVPLNEGIVFFHELTRENALKTCEVIFSGSSLPDAIFACNDTTAIAVLEYARKHHIRIPQDVMLTGYSNDPRSEITEPAVTSVEQFPYEVGDQAATLMMNLLRHKIKQEDNYVSITTPVELIRRASSGTAETKVVPDDKAVSPGRQIKAVS